jgi:hypothetical protein
MCVKQGIGYHAYEAFRRALVLCIREYKTLDLESLRSALPLTTDERQAKVNPISMMEDALFSSNDLHYQMNKRQYPKDWDKLENHRQMISAFHEFYLELTKIGNTREARAYYVKERKTQKARYLLKRELGQASLFLAWEATCGYGESLSRWILTCGIILIVFTVIYAWFHLIQPVSSWFDYFYFSAVTLTTLGYGDIHPVGIAGKLVACVEVVIGLLMFGMLLTYVNRRIFQ